ncbi:hypothetical protein [Tichowtungia aerotolerans]|uniref:Uncharacterized protein n=1 Tax=Tichowtungia aerotolerans TaxID=2697043 RepID=A0A6P1M4H0_9BACT|nr:hypothetical protein [Tichowtungia aerotolerans]QHI68731.1 hypothetical protein GT409_04465 [Tichowtungia aerotolerans]
MKVVVGIPFHDFITNSDPGFRQQIWDSVVDQYRYRDGRDGDYDSENDSKLFPFKAGDNVSDVSSR